MTDVYVTALAVSEIFADPTYQRDVDPKRVKKMSETWDRRLAGILEVSDRGDAAAPRYAVIDGQHRWAAAALLECPPNLVANVHAALTVADEAALFDKLNRQRKQTGPWDHWKARRAAADPVVAEIEAIVQKHGLMVNMSPCDGSIACVTAMEKVVQLGGIPLLDNTLELICGVWDNRRDAFDTQIVRGIALVLYHLNSQLDGPRLFDALLDVMPRQLKAQATAVREITPGTTAVLTAIAIMGLYNKRPGRKILVSARSFGGGATNARIKAATA